MLPRVSETPSFQKLSGASTSSSLCELNCGKLRPRPDAEAVAGIFAAGKSGGRAVARARWLARGGSRAVARARWLACGGSRTVVRHFLYCLCEYRANSVGL